MSEIHDGGEPHFPETNLPAAVPAAGTGRNKYLYVLSMGHGFVDMNQGALPAILPFLIAAAGLKYAQAAGLTFAIAFTASMIQPLFGLLADRGSKFWLLPVGIILGGLGISLVGLFPNHYWIMISLALVSGVGIAAYHPEAARIVNKMSGEKKSGNMSIFSVGGTVGVALGPKLATSALLYMGLNGTVFLAIPPIMMAIVFFIIGPKIQSVAALAEAEEKKTALELKNEWGKFTYLSLGIFSRSIMSQSLNTFLPLYWLNVLGQSKAFSGIILSFMLIMGALGNIVGGHLADRFGLFKIMRIGWILLIPAMFFLTRTANPILAMLILGPLAFVSFMVATPMIVLNQKYLPKNIGFASGISMGLGVSLGGMVTPLLGNYADHHGLAAALSLLAVLPVIGTVIAFTIKPPARV